MLGVMLLIVCFFIFLIATFNSLVIAVVVLTKTLAPFLLLK